MMAVQTRSVERGRRLARLSWAFTAMLKSLNVIFQVRKAIAFKQRVAVIRLTFGFCFGICLFACLGVYGILANWKCG